MEALASGFLFGVGFFAVISMAVVIVALIKVITGKN